MKVIILCFACLLYTAVFASPEGVSGSANLKFSKSSVQVTFEKNGNNLECVVRRGEQVVQRIKLDSVFPNHLVQRDGNVMTLNGTGKTLRYEIIKDESDFSLIKVSRDITDKTRTETDCVNLDIGQTSWFGGPENRYQYWPIEKASFKDYSFVTKEADNCAIAERYWLSSKGTFLFVNESSPLFIDQNTDEYPNQLCLSVKFALPYDSRASKYEFSYYIGVAADAKQAHLKALEHGIFKKPTGYPDEAMVRYPIWSTWAEYKDAINKTIVTEFAEKILANNFTHSQLEIDDKWETCYGSTIFDQSDSKFPNIREYIQELHEKGFRLTLWIHPFINEECPEHAEAAARNYLVKNRDGSTLTSWWVKNGNRAGYVDFTNPEAAAWFKGKLKAILDLGIDGFKFDAGESSFSPSGTVFHGRTLADPSDIVRAYIRTVASFGNITEVRSGQGTQDLSVFLRMLDKDTRWGWNNGLVTLITTLLQLNMVGYPFVLPDMIGGNGYDDSPPDYEIFIRWLQANVFMPSIQYSYVPWDFVNNEANVDAVAICKKFTELHSGWVSDEIINRFKKAVETGEPVNPPLWWIAPKDPVAFQIYDQFLLGEDYIVAPVIQKGQTQRDIYLPKGTWQDGNSEKVYHGPRWVMDYPAPLDILPYFKRVK